MTQADLQDVHRNYVALSYGFPLTWLNLSCLMACVPDNVAQGILQAQWAAVQPKDQTQESAPTMMLPPRAQRRSMGMRKPMNQLAKIPLRG
jgi:hypothetical protein